MSQVISGGDPSQKSRYLNRFRQFETVNFPPFELMGDIILVERLKPIESKTSSGIIIPTGDNGSYKQTARDSVLELGLVLLTGPGDVDGDGIRIEMSVLSGQIIELPMNISWYSQFGNMKDYEPYSIGKMRASQALLLFADYEGAMEVLNGCV